MNSTKPEKLKTWLIIVLVVAIGLRVLLFLTYPAVSYSDTPSYRRSADAVLGGFRQYDGTRTPGYPVFIALVGPDRVVYAVQLLLGLMITMAWFVMGWKASGKPVFGAIMALLHTLNPGQLFFEANLLTETLSTFFLTLSLAGAFIWLHDPKYRTIWLGLGIGFFSSLATLTRPLFIFMPVWLAVFLASSYSEKRLNFDWKPVVGIFLPTVLLVGGWMMWVRSNYHVFSLTTMTGYHLVQHTGYYFDHVPDEYADLRDVFLDYRDERIREYGTPGNAIWDAIPAMQAASGMSFYQLSRTLQRISIDLILNHPFEYLSRVLRGWWLFWRAPVYWRSSAISSPAINSAFHWGILAARGVLFVMNLVFVLTSAAAFLFKRLRPAMRLTMFHWMLAGAVWASSILSSILDHGDNPRFLVPLQTAVVFWTLWVLISLFYTWRRNGADWRVSSNVQ